MVPVFSGCGLVLASMVFRASDVSGRTVPDVRYIAVDDLEEVNLFYYFVKSDRNPAEDPSCCGSPVDRLHRVSGLAYEIGPLAFDIENYEEEGCPVLVHREESWTRYTQLFSRVVLGFAVGVGFSYSTAAEENEWSDTSATRRLRAFIRKWLVDHPEFISNPLRLWRLVRWEDGAPRHPDDINGSDSLKSNHSSGNEAGVKPSSISRNVLMMGRRFPYSHGMGLISDELYEETKESCGGDYVNPRNTKCIECLNAVYKNWERLEIQFTLGVYCDLKSPKPKQSAEYKFLAIKSWVGSIGEWNRCQKYIKANYGFDVPSSVPYHLNVTSKGFRSLVYSGDHDLEINFMGTQAWIRSFNFSIVDDWRHWLLYTRAYANNLTFATVKGAGHVVTEYKRKETWAMFERWIAGQAL
ncbi:unnamed protein product [Spirodela intermedia]|uniref:Uncharacterized protein n=1 Tax=Spirodela intermedia TaxID=51605 RepID=A0ABN7ECA0_SPIIN|nr:unnamed protein product [Spirodela intermedia]